MTEHVQELLLLCLDFLMPHRQLESDFPYYQRPLQVRFRFRPQENLNWT